MHTEIRHPSDPPTVKTRQVIPARNPAHARETQRQLSQLHREYLQRMRAIMERVKLR